MLLALRLLLVFDAAVLVVLGGALVAAPHRVLDFFHFPPVPGEVQLIMVQWGCALATMALGYALAATDPFRHVAWIQVGIARGSLETLAGLVLIARGVVRPDQAMPGIAVAAFVAVAYLVLYPRPSMLPLEETPDAAP